MRLSNKLIANLAEIDREAIDTLGIPGLLLMEAAGQAITDAAQTQASITSQSLQGVLIFCGKGNNGGDGFVCARHLARKGIHPITVLHTAMAEEMKGDALTNFNLLKHYPITVEHLSHPERLEDRLEKAGVIVDALFGTGLSKPITGNDATLIAMINRHGQETGKPVIAIDIPSGIDGATGQVWGNAIQATQTITFAAAKPGLYLYPGKAHAGQVQTVDIGIPHSLIDAADSTLSLLDDTQVREWLPKRNPAGHKFTFGHVLVLAGSKDMPGAAILSATAALTAGAGMVTLAAPQSVFERASIPPEIVRRLLPESESGTFCPASFTALDTELSGDWSKYQAIVLGPGMGQHPDTLAFFDQILTILKDYTGTVILDADGLNALGKQRSGGKMTKLSSKFILTPHVGEFLRLFPMERSWVEGNLVAAASQAQHDIDAQVILKSATPVIAGTSNHAWLSPRGTSGMATAGSGDVLTGILAGLAAQGMTPEIAAPTGVYLHGLAGELAAESLTPYAMTAGDITRMLGKAFKTLLP